MNCKKWFTLEVIIATMCDDPYYGVFRETNVLRVFATDEDVVDELMREVKQMGVRTRSMFGFDPAAITYKVTRLMPNGTCSHSLELSVARKLYPRLANMVGWRRVMKDKWFLTFSTTKKQKKVLANT